MRRTGRLVIAGAVVLLSLATIFLTARKPAEAHGSMQAPPSRIYTCYLENPESPDSAACKDAVALGGTQPLYDWNEINIATADGRHREIIPDGRLCSAGRDKYRAFDVARSDWPATGLPTSGSFRFLYKATAPHRGRMELYVTRDGYDPQQPLRWSDLETTPFHTEKDPPLVDGAYAMDAPIPLGKSGRHLIYTIWQRSDSPEAFYSCADVVFGKDTPPQDPAPTDPVPTEPAPDESTDPTHDHGDVGHPDESESPEPEPSPSSDQPEAPADPGDAEPWQAFRMYGPGETVSYEGRVYRCIQGHTSLPDWQPSAVPALWQAVKASGTAEWETQVYYDAGDQVVHDGLTYRARVAHTSLPGWEPPNTPALWQQE
jgi:chitin-binding protein